MDLVQNLALGFGVAFTAQNLLYAFFGALLGTLIGVLPGLGPVATIAMLLPSIYALDATPALIMLAGIYYGAPYGGAPPPVPIHPPGPGRPRLVLRRLRRHDHHRGIRAAADRTRLQVRPGRILFADGARPDRRRRARIGLAA